MALRFCRSVLFLVLIQQLTCQPHRSFPDVALLTGDQNPKCFTQILTDFTCFWEANPGATYDFLYSVDGDEWKCNLTEMEQAAGKLLHICSFPSEHVYLFMSTNISVVDHQTRKTVYSRSSQVQKQILLDPPSVQPLVLTGEPMQLLVRWNMTFSDLNPQSDLQYELRYSSGSQEKITKIQQDSAPEHRLVSLNPGQMCTVQMRVKPMGIWDGYWSAWSPPVTAMVPQSADDLELRCYTPDLQRVRCRWRKGLYNRTSLYHRQRDSGSWRAWKVCDERSSSGTQCVFYGDEDAIFQVYITAQHLLYNQTFYKDEFRMTSSIRTEAPGGLNQGGDDGRLCVNWRCPLPNITEDLMYQVQYQLRPEGEWKHFSVNGPQTQTCLHVQASGQYVIQIRARPSGSRYSGDWSTWSEPLTLQLSSHTGSSAGVLLTVCVPFLLRIGSAELIFIFLSYVRKLKQFLWPPVPNLNNVLGGFLKDMDAKDWDSRPDLQTSITIRDLEKIPVLVGSVV